MPLYKGGLSGGGGGPGGNSPPKVGDTLAELGTGDFDGQTGILRVGTFPNIHEEVLAWNDTAGQWIGNPVVVMTQQDSWAMDLGNKPGSLLTGFGVINNAIPWGKAYTVLNGAVAANAGTQTVKARRGNGPAFTSTGTILIRDNIITYTGISGAQSGDFSFTGCTLVSGTGGTIPSGTDVVQGWPGGYGFACSSIPFVDELWDAGLTLQERISALMNGSPETGKTLTVSPYWYEYDDGDGYVSPADPPSGGLGFSSSLTGTTDPGAASKLLERSFFFVESEWVPWDSTGDAKTPTKRYLVPRLYGKMSSAAVDTGQVLDTILRLRWVG